MKKLLCWLVAVIVIITLLAGCNYLDSLEEVSRKPVDVKFEVAYSSVETDYEYKYNAWRGEMQLVPNTHTVHHPDTWYALYEITYADGHTETEWVEVGELEYGRIKAELGG